MKSTWLYSLAVLIGGACFGILSTFVKIGYGQGADLVHVVMTQFFFWLYHFSNFTVILSPKKDSD